VRGRRRLLNNSSDLAKDDQLNRELHHRNLVALREVILEDKAIYMVFEYAEHDFLVRIPHPTPTSSVAH
jgi:cyclin-dependent kinase 8/11